MHTVETHAVEAIATGTAVYEIIAQTPSTVTLRSCKAGYKVAGCKWPVVYRKALTDPTGDVITLHLREDGTFRRASGTSPIHFTSDAPFRIDY